MPILVLIVFGLFVLGLCLFLIILFISMNNNIEFGVSDMQHLSGYIWFFQEFREFAYKKEKPGLLVLLYSCYSIYCIAMILLFVCVCIAVFN